MQNGVCQPPSVPSVPSVGVALVLDGSMPEIVELIMGSIENSDGSDEGCPEERVMQGAELGRLNRSTARSPPHTSSGGRRR